MGQRPVKASNGQYWRAKKASMAISSCSVSAKLYDKPRGIDIALPQHRQHRNLILNLEGQPRVRLS